MVHISFALFVLMLGISVNGQASPPTTDPDPIVAEYTHAMYAKILSNNDANQIYSTSLPGNVAGDYFYSICLKNLKAAGYGQSSEAISKKAADGIRLIKNLTLPIYLTAEGDSAGRFFLKKNMLNSTNAASLGEGEATDVQHFLKFKDKSQMPSYFDSFTKVSINIVDDLFTDRVKVLMEFAQLFYDVLKEAA